MRKIIFLLTLSSLFLISLSTNTNSTFAMTFNGKCYYCPDKESHTVTAYEAGTHVEEPTCGYIITGCTGVGCTEGIEIAKVPTENGGACTTAKPLCDNYKGCVADGGGTDLECRITIECNSEDNSHCNRPGGRICDKNYCIYKDPETGTKFQWTLGYYDRTGLKGKCDTLDSAPETNPEDGDDAPVTTNTPLSRPCSDGDYDAGKGGCTRIKTAFGNVSTSAAGFTRWVLGFVLSISGGIVIIIIIITGYRLMTSQGDPEKVKNARDQLTAAIVGLLFIIFSLVILELITKDVLGLPGFGG